MFNCKWMQESKVLSEKKKMLVTHNQISNKIDENIFGV